MAEYAFNSLSRDHCTRPPPAVRASCSTFNSLSRDHSALSGAQRVLFPSCAFQLPLSGSHSASPPSPVGGGLTAFQLPLSGSPQFMRPVANAFVHDFQLPLSGSLGLRKRRSQQIYIPENFQLPLSGSHHNNRGFVNFRMGWENFQLPLSGSPSPIPGFFGSPRLSAAAPFRTNDS